MFENHDVVEEPVLEEKNLNITIIREAIDMLPSGYRVVFSLYAIEGYDHEEISEILDISISTSKSQYHRARKRLKEIILSTNNNNIHSLYK